MKLISTRLGTAALAAALVVVSAANADDTEVFFGDPTATSAQPNVLMVIDTSGSMADHVVTQPIYKPGETYAGSCSPNRIYWATGSTPPTCSTDQWFDERALVCEAARTAFTTTGGFYYGRAQQHRSNGNWSNLNTGWKDRRVECESDWGIHGDNGGTAHYPRNHVSNPFQSGTRDAISWSGRQRYRIYNANYLNWYHENRLSTLSKMEIVKGVSQTLVDTISGVNLGLMRFSNNDEDNETEDNRAQGGMILHPVSDIATSRQAIRDTIGTFQPRGFTPLSEVLYEAALYFRGSTWDYGSYSRGYDDEVLLRSVRASRTAADANRYKTPIEYACQENYIVYLTDGLPTADRHARSKIETLIGRTCNDAAGITGDGRCLDDLAGFLSTADQSSLPGDAPNGQHVITHTIGFDIDFPLLKETAVQGKGDYYTANDTGSLVDALTAIVGDIAETSATFSSPAVAVNAFNRSQHENDLFVTVFSPSNTTRWAGNLKRYRFNTLSEQIEDKNGNAAVDPDTGFFVEDAQELWSASADGNTVTEGGAAQQLPLPNDRKVYTYHPTSGSTSLAANPFSLANPVLTAAALDLRDAEDPTAEQLIQWARGAVINEDGTINTAVSRKEMGDPLHSKPVTVVYGEGTTTNPLKNTVVYVATNDGYLHAVDADTGKELWSFIPSEMWPRLHLLMQNTQTDQRTYGIDGGLYVVQDVEAQKYYLYFGMRRGGDFYYALDITDRNSPQFLWKSTPTQLPGLGQTWSTPTAFRVQIGTRTYKALAIGGGYEPDQDPNRMTGVTTHSTDVTGNRVFIIDAMTGQPLWTAGPVVGANLQLDKMQYSIPSEIRVVDFNNDRYADRMYVGDMGGQLWRFDIHNGKPVADLVTGGVIASLGNASATSHPASTLRRFFSPPNVAIVRKGQHNYVTLAIGSGHREGPLNTETDDLLYVVRDFDIFRRLTQEQYENYNVLYDADVSLIDVTAPPAEPGEPMDITVAPLDRGWKYRLTNDGEKTVAEATTLNFEARFTTYTPASGESDNPCLPNAGTNSEYLFDLLSGQLKKVVRRTSSSIASGSIVLFLPDEGEDKNNDGQPDPPEECEEGEECEEPKACDPSDPACKNPPPEECKIGEVCEATCLWELGPCEGNLENPAVRSFWRQQDIDTQ